MLNLLSVPLVALLSLSHTTQFPSAPLRSSAPQLESPRSNELFTNIAPDQITTFSGELGEGGLTLLGILQSYSRGTGQALVMEPVVRQSLAEESGLVGQVSLPGNSVHSFVQELLYNNGFVLQVLDSVTPPTLVVHSPATNRNKSLLAFARPVSVEELDTYDKYPAMLIETTLSFSELDPRQIANSMRAMNVSPMSHGTIPIGTSNSLAITGPARHVIRLAQKLSLANEAKAAKFEGSLVVSKISLSNAQAGEISNLVYSLMSGGPAPEGDPGAVQLRVVADVRSNALLLRGTSVQVKEAAAIVALLDTEQ